MDDSKVLSTEEVDAILQATQDQTGAENPLTVYSTHLESVTQVTLKNINEVIRIEWQKSLSLLLRKKITLEIKKYRIENLASVATQITGQGVFSIYSINPGNQYGLVMLNLGFIHQATNILFGAQLDPEEPILEKAGHNGVIITEKIAKNCVPACAAAFAEYIKIDCEIIKTSATPIFTPYLPMNTRMYVIDYTVYFDGIETQLFIAIPEETLQAYLPNETLDNQIKKEEPNWKNIVTHQLLDSTVWITANLPETQLTLKEFRQLKKDDVIPIEDPTNIFLMLENVKLFKAVSGQANDKRVAKITEKLGE
jgi:flagellar motor switch protein FliM